MMDIYDALVQLQYPKITLINVKDVETQILAGQNRICLLSWLLQQNSEDSFLLLNKLKGAALEERETSTLKSEELFKYYNQMGICCDKEQLLGNCSLRNQLSTIKLLLMFIKNFKRNQSLEEQSNGLSVNDDLQSYFEKDVNILPDNFSLSTRLSQAETNKYMEESRKSVKEVKTTFSDYNSMSLKNNSESLIEEKMKYIQDVKNDQCKISLEKFTESFKTLNCESKEQQILLPQTFNMNKIINSIDVNLSTINQALNCKDEVIQLAIPTGLQITEAPLTETVDENLFWLQRVSNAISEIEEIQ